MACPVEAQLIAYNARDVEAFMRCYTHDVVLENAAGEVVCADHDAMRERYAAAFAREPMSSARSCTESATATMWWITNTSRGIWTARRAMRSRSTVCVTG